MSSIYIITETLFDEPVQRHYRLILPEVSEPGFYREVCSYSWFFSSPRNPKSNVTDKRQFTARSLHDFQNFGFTKEIDVSTLQEFKNIWEFYSFIGWDRKKRQYANGEKLKKIIYPGANG